MNYFIAKYKNIRKDSPILRFVNICKAVFVKVVRNLMFVV